MNHSTKKPQLHQEQQEGSKLLPTHPTLIQPIPENRTYESVLHHYDVECAIAARLMVADREARKKIYSTMYDELFAQVPDHPRLTRRADAQLTEEMNRRKMTLVTPFLKEDGIFLEFGAGDCRFSFEVAQFTGQVYAVDIADQIGTNVVRPDNFRLVVYNGYELDLPDSSVDTAFSDQLIEHLHPEDTAHHFQLVHRLLKPGGAYIFRTPHRLTGPHDVSRYFSGRAEGFHLKEWTYGELAELVENQGFRSLQTYWFARNRLIRLPIRAFRTTETLAAYMPLSRRRGLRYLLPGISMAVFK